MWSRKRKPRLAKIEDEFPASEGDRSIQEPDPSVTSSLEGGSPAASSAATAAAQSSQSASEASAAAAGTASAAVVPAATPTSPVNPAIPPASVAERPGERADAGFNDAKEAVRATAVAENDNPVTGSRGFGGCNSGGLDDSGAINNATISQEETENSSNRTFVDSTTGEGGGSEQENETGSTSAAADAAAAGGDDGDAAAAAGVADSEFMSESPVRYVPLAFDRVTSGLEDEISLLERLVANHLMLSQFELARAAVRDLARLSRSRAISLLRNVIVRRGEIPGASVPSAAHLTWLSSD
ncbi:unnamed protein product [Closterium sp. NIES-54]